MLTCDLPESYSGVRARITALLNVLLLVPSLVAKLAKLQTCSGRSFDAFSQNVPSDVPRSIALILSANKFTVPYPPEVPFPYLDANKVMQVPSQKDVPAAQSLWNEYLTLYQTHSAAESVRLCTEASTFVSWCCLISSVEHATVYEKDASLLKKEGLSVLGELIGNELRSIYQASSVEYQQTMLNLVPKVVLVEVYSGCRSEVNLELSPETIPTRELVVHVSDMRSREGTKMPPTADLAIAAVKYTSQFSLEGFVCSGEGTSVIYHRQSKFRISLFQKGLFSYAINARS